MDRCRSIARTTSRLYGTYAFRIGLNVSLGLELESGAPLTALRRAPDLRRWRRDSADGSRRRISDVGRLPDAHAVDQAGQRRGVVQRETRRPQSAADCRRVQRLQHADGSRLRQLLRAPVRRAESGLRPGRLRRASSAGSSSRRRGNSDSACATSSDRRRCVGGAALKGRSHGTAP